MFLHPQLMSGKSDHIWKIALLVMLISAGCSYGQGITTGIVVDSATMAALPFVNIQVKNSGVGTRTDDKGNFSIRAEKKDTLVFTLVGYERLELSLADYEPAIIRLSEKYTLLEAVTIDEYRQRDLYEGMFDDQNARLKKNIPFYFSKAKKEKIKLQILKNENLRVQTYVDVVVTNPELKHGLMKKYSLTEREYYDILRAFNEQHYEVMYYLTRGELISLVNTFFESQASVSQRR
jgi:hypothetical protein